MAPERDGSDISSLWLVDSWIASSQSNLDPNFGYIESLYNTCTTALQQLWKSRSSLSLTDGQQFSLKNDVAQLSLWEENFPSCRLDTILGHSNYLRIEVLENLYGIGKILMQFYHSVSARSEHVHFPETEYLSILLEKAVVILSENDISDSSMNSDTDSDCSLMSEAGENQQERLHCYISCLMELGPSIERQIGNIQYKLDQQASPELNRFSLSENAQPFAIRIKDRFKDAKVPLAERLAEANWERSVRFMTHEFNSARSVPDTVMTLFKPFSIFYDSGLGTSVPSRSQYANTVSSHSSFISMAGEDEGRPRVPPLPQEGQNYRAFQCPFCGTHIRCRNRIDWKMHVFADLQAYVCTHDTCKDAMKTFPSRKLWAEHEFKYHLSNKQWACFACSMVQDSPEGFIEHLRTAHDIELNEPRRQLEELSRAQKFTQKPDFGDHICQLCLKSGWQTMKAYATHVGRHLEEISLASLPKLPDDDTISDSNASQESIMAGTTPNTARFDKMTSHNPNTGTDHTPTLNSVSERGSLHYDQDRLKEKEEMYHQAPAGEEKVLGPEHPDTLTRISNLGLVLADQGKYEEAEAMLQQALQRCEKALGPEHPVTLIRISNLGLVLADQGKYEEAEAMLQQALQGCEKVLGPEHPVTLIRISNLGLVLADQGKYEEAEAMLQQALQGCEKVLGPENPVTLSSMACLATTYFNQGCLVKAEELHMQVFESRKRMLGPEHPDTLASMRNLAFTLKRTREGPYCIQLLKECVDLSNTVLGADHPHTALSSNTLLSWETNLAGPK
ncbi:hypothetical protein BDV18DRAFT_26095 [Aspergillus unguis]